MGFTNPGATNVAMLSRKPPLRLSSDGKIPGEMPFTRMGTSVDANRVASATVSWSNAALLAP